MLFPVDFSIWLSCFSLCAAVQCTHAVHAGKCMCRRARESARIRATRLLLFLFLFRCFEVTWCVSMLFPFSSCSLINLTLWLGAIENWNVARWMVFDIYYLQIRIVPCRKLCCCHESIFHIHHFVDRFYECFSGLIVVFRVFFLLSSRYPQQRYESSWTISNGTKKNSWKNITMAIKMHSFARRMLSIHSTNQWLLNDRKWNAQERKNVKFASRTFLQAYVFNC